MVLINTLSQTAYLNMCEVPRLSHTLATWGRYGNAGWVRWTKFNVGDSIFVFNCILHGSLTFCGFYWAVLFLSLYLVQSVRVAR